MRIGSLCSIRGGLWKRGRTMSCCSVVGRTRGCTRCSFGGKGRPAVKRNGASPNTIRRRLKSAATLIFSLRDEAHAVVAGGDIGRSANIDIIGHGACGGVIGHDED